MIGSQFIFVKLSINKTKKKNTVAKMKCFDIERNRFSVSRQTHCWFCVVFCFFFFRLIWMQTNKQIDYQIINLCYVARSIIKASENIIDSSEIAKETNDFQILFKKKKNCITRSLFVWYRGMFDICSSSLFDGPK